MTSMTSAPAERRSDYRGLLAPVKRHVIVLVVSLLVIVVVVIVAEQLAGSPSWTRFEVSFDQLLSQHHVSVLDVSALTIRWVLSPIQGLVIVCMVSAGVLWRTRDWLVSLTFALMVAGGWLSSELIKLVVHRARPDYHLLAHPLSTESIFDSFPSGHVCLATALAFGFILLLRGRPSQKWTIIVGIAGVVVVAWSRLYIGEHYPTDVVGSMIYTSAAMLSFLVIWSHWLVPPLERSVTKSAGRETSTRGR